MKILSFFLLFWVIFALLDPDPVAQINADPCGSGYGSETLFLGLQAPDASTVKFSFFVIEKQCADP
jgi:hypothetical protein